MDQPASTHQQHIVRLQDSVERLQERIEQLQGRIEQLEEEIRALHASLATSDSLRAGLHDATVQAAQVAEAALDKLIRATKRDESVVQAAYALVGALVRGASDAEGERLSGVLVEAVLAHQAGAPS